MCPHGLELKCVIGFKRCGWSKSPTPTSGQDKAGQIIVEACSALRDIFV